MPTKTKREGKAKGFICWEPGCRVPIKRGERFCAKHREKAAKSA